MRHFYLQDVFEPEPKILVAKMFGFGVLAFLLSFAVQKFIMNLALIRGILELFTFTESNLFRAFLVIALSEEFVKLLVFCLVMYGHTEFDEPMDGIVYSISCALGFATAENVAYMFTYSSTILAVRMIFSCFLHAGCSGLSGYYIGLAKFAPEQKGTSYFSKGLFLAWFLHGFYDFIVFSRYFNALLLIVVLLWAAKVFLDSKIKDALERSPFK